MVVQDTSMSYCNKTSKTLGAFVEDNGHLINSEKSHYVFLNRLFNTETNGGGVGSLALCSDTFPIIALIIFKELLIVASIKIC